MTPADEHAPVMTRRAYLTLKALQGGALSSPGMESDSVTPDPIDHIVAVAQAAALDMVFDWYCPKNPTRPRRECRECVAEIAARAVWPVVEDLIAEAKADALREAADWVPVDLWSTFGMVPRKAVEGMQEWLRARAAALGEGS